VSKADVLPVLVNRGGGSVGPDEAALVRSLEQAAASAGLTLDVQVIDGGAIADAAGALVRAAAPVVAVGGGDGSQSAAAGALAGSDTALGILPLGTLNHLARDLDIAFDLPEAFRIIAAGHRRRIDLAEVNGRIFVNNSAVGLYPLMVLDRDAQRKRIGRSKRLALLVASARTLARFRHGRLTLTTQKGKASIDTPLLFVGNNDYDVALPSPGRRAALDDGKLCVLMLRKTSRLGFVAASLRALMGRARHDDLIRLDVAGELRVDSRRSHLAVAVDGETVHLPTPLIYRLRRAALQVIVPAQTA
jgi:diacylglycerol kinase family enzyme